MINALLKRLIHFFFSFLLDAQAHLQRARRRQWGGTPFEFNFGQTNTKKLWRSGNCKLMNENICILVRFVYLDFFRVSCVRSFTMLFEPTNQKMNVFSVKILFGFPVKGISKFSTHLSIRCQNDIWFWLHRTRTNPDYYSSIKQPIDFIRIQQKIRTDEYETLQQFVDDIQLLLTNAKSFYKVKRIVMLFWFRN